jgi:enoyl-CoA hydratase/carnithine racemase
MPATATLTQPADGVGLVVFDNPPRNFLTPDLRQVVTERVLEARAAGCRVVVLTSDRPGYFIAHASLESIVRRYERKPVEMLPPGSGTDLRVELDTGPMISIAAVNGQAWGGGAETCWACNLRIAGESAHFGQPEVPLGIIPGAGGTTKLARVVGFAKCMELIVDCRPIDAREALRIGAVNRVVPDAELRSAAVAWAALIASWPAWALRAAKQSLVEGRDIPIEQAQRNESRIFRDVASRDDALAIMRKAQARYDAGDDSFDAIGIPRPR